MSYKILDFGYVEYIDHMGSDQRIEEAARVSYGDGTRKVSEMKTLLRYLFRHEHTSPFESAMLQVKMKVPIFVARQIMRHRTFSYSEVSGRYSVMPDEMYVPDISEMKTQSTDNKQGRGELLEDPDQGRFILDSGMENAREYYNSALETGMARELARTVLPLSQYTEFYMTGNLNNWFRFLKLRLHEHAQYEVRVVALAIEGLLRKLFPISYEAFEDYSLYGVRLSQQEVETIRTIIQITEHEANKDIEKIAKQYIKGKRELAEFFDKF